LESSASLTKKSRKYVAFAKAELRKSWHGVLSPGETVRAQSSLFDLDVFGVKTLRTI
jgi:hypothetical protein